MSGRLKQVNRAQIVPFTQLGLRIRKAQSYVEVRIVTYLKEVHVSKYLVVTPTIVDIVVSEWPQQSGTVMKVYSSPLLFR